ncbi:GGDEF domain-containing protein [Teredinibacter purpureus]|uniref:GGDEF domain-containing protein n=1 Tax=Teredinibacter purpureus TaxID=2731756 RepID=UPI000696565D|nr:GGDEF domain-containing protein [Teredinibacter purpureus]
MVTLASKKQTSDASVSPALAAHSKTPQWSQQNATGFPAENSLRDLQFRLANNLQSSLDLTTTLELFYSNIQEAVSLSGLQYTAPPDAHSETADTISLGLMRAHKANYNIKTADSTLGQIVFSRAKQFLETELAILEMMVGVLFFPLRNALLYQEALQNSQRDSLTGIGNRAAFDITVARELKLAQRHKQHLSLLVIDIDYFKAINDQYGHQNGDCVLKHVTRNIKQGLRETDQFFRYGGEEFVVLLNNTHTQDAQLIAERIRLNIATSPVNIVLKDNVLATVSIGVSEQQCEDTIDSLFASADGALYQAKSLGRNRVEVCDR